MEDKEAVSREAAEELRLFPLNVVLFPGMSMPLRIFEERYKLMIGECLEESAPFGVVLIREGMEVGGPATPHRVGTTARITQVERLEDGRMNLATAGERRFCIVETVHELPYLKGKVCYLQEELAVASEEVVERARELFNRYVTGLAGLQGGWLRDAGISGDAITLSYTIAQHLELPAKARQRLLELPQADERLRYEIPLLEGANQSLRERIVKRTPYEGPRLN